MANLTSIQAQIGSIQEDLRQFKASTDTFYLLYSGVVVFFMQAGFGVRSPRARPQRSPQPAQLSSLRPRLQVLEAGSVRIKNTRNILLKNLLDACVAAMIWWAWGHGAAYQYGGDGNAFIGTPGDAHFANKFSGENESESGADFAGWWFQYVFAAAAATIVSGAMAERAQLGAYVVYTTVITGLIYPVIVHWAWDGHGWISATNPDAFLGGVIDFAGSGVVHMTGGCAAFWGAMIIGPRKGRFVGGNVVAIEGHSTVLQVLGTMILWMGWYGFNPGSTLAISPEGSAAQAARAAVCTTLSAAMGGLTVVIVSKMKDHVWNVGALCNGILGGLVSVTASCGTIYPWSATIIGFVGGCVYLSGSALLLKLKIDDPLDAFAVHGCCGFWACIACGLFTAPQYAYGAGEGLFYGGTKQIGAQLVFLLANLTWTSTIASSMFMLLKMFGVLRISSEVEEVGMDISKHGGSAYIYTSDGKDPSITNSAHSSTTRGGSRRDIKVSPAADKYAEPGTGTTPTMDKVSDLTDP